MSEQISQELDATVLSEDAERMQKYLLSTIIGQERAVKLFTQVFQQILVGMNREGRPAGVFLFTGPTGVGKTELVRRAAEFVLGKKDAITRIDCSEFQESHEVSKLIGSPPGYVGYNDKESVRLSQENLDKYQTPIKKINFLLFDEIEEAHEALLSSILQILDAGRLTLGNGATTDFTKTIVILTSNLGEKETQQVLSGEGLGFKNTETDPAENDNKVYSVSKKAATKYFRAKFMNRIDRLVVFRSLTEESLRKILKLELLSIQERVWKSSLAKWEPNKEKLVVFRPVFRTTPEAQNFLIKEGTSKIYGVRELNRTLDRFVVFPIGSLIGSKQIESDDIIQIDHKPDSDKLSFTRIGKRDIKPLTNVQSNASISPLKVTPPSTPPRIPFWEGV